jgi:hypothetical protein
MMQGPPPTGTGAPKGSPVSGEIKLTDPPVTSTVPSLSAVVSTGISADGFSQNRDLKTIVSTKRGARPDV